MKDDTVRPQDAKTCDARFSEPVKSARVFDRPPGALPGWMFEDRCTRCHDCCNVCPVGILHPDEEGFPVVIAPHRCSNCGLCADVCSPAAIRFTERTSKGIEKTLKAERRRALRGNAPAF